MLFKTRLSLCRNASEVGCHPISPSPHLPPCGSILFYPSLCVDRLVSAVHKQTQAPTPLERLEVYCNSDSGTSKQNPGRRLVISNSKHFRIRPCRTISDHMVVVSWEPGAALGAIRFEAHAEHSLSGFLPPNF